MRKNAKSIETFKKEAFEIHGDKYDYSDFIYVNNKTKGIIHCNKCGYTFEMIPSNHICKKQGCPKCENRLKYTTEECINKCKETHGDKYDYSKTEYLNGHTKICIICPIHGEFYQSPRKHWNGQGCPKCSNTTKIGFDEFVERSSKMHNGKYHYHIGTYDSFSNKTLITCPKHGDFWQNAQAHSLGQGCPKCYKEDKKDHNKIQFIEFKDRANKIHNGRYKYDEESYVNYTTKVRILCNKHGWFEQMPQKHVERHHGCPKCAKEKQSERQKLTKEEFIKRSIETHGDRYDYSESIYNGNSVPLKIICKRHGEFWQQPNKHWRGQGCPKCNQSHLERNVEKILKELNIDFHYQATKKNLSFLGMKSLDFYIPKYNIAIECQGIQHFEDNGFLKCEQVIVRDKEKFKLCEENRIKLVYYTNLKEKAKNNDFYNDKTIFYEENNLRKFLNSYETAN